MKAKKALPVMIVALVAVVSLVAYTIIYPVNYPVVPSTTSQTVPSSTTTSESTTTASTQTVPSSTTTSESTTTASTQTVPSSTTTSEQVYAPKVGDFFPYGCGKPANESQFSCDKTPAGYAILPRLPNAPSPWRFANITDSAWQLLQKTYANGVCDPNETWTTSPLDCGATGAMRNDPYTGRPSAPATVCQIVAQQEEEG